MARGDCTRGVAHATAAGCATVSRRPMGSRRWSDPAIARTLAAVNREAIVERLRSSVEGLVAVYLFGSVARGDDHPESDVDVAVLASRPLDAVLRWELQERLAVALGRDVDLVDLRAASAVLRVRVLAVATLLWTSGGAGRESFEAFALADYARLNEERRGILDDVARLGTVHG